MTRTTRPTVAVVGAGIAGLAAAWELVTSTAAGGRPVPEVHLLEAADHLGGRLQAAELAGRTVDLAADAFLARRPEATELCHEVGLGGDLVPVGASGAALWARGRLRPMPGGLNLGVPTRWWPLLRSGILTVPESLRVARDLVPPHLRSPVTLGDRSVGEIVGERLGRGVVDRLVDPLVGGIHAGSVDDLSAAATFPLLIAASQQPGSLMHRLGRARPPAAAEDTPAFWSLLGGTASLARGLGEQLGRRGVAVHTGVSVEAIERSDVRGRGPARWDLTLGSSVGGSSVGGSRAGRSSVGGSSVGGSNGGGVEEGYLCDLASRDRDGTASPGHGGTASLKVDGIVLAVPAPEAAVLVAPHAPVAGGALSTIDHASIALVTLSIPRAALRAPLEGTGFLVPSTSTIEGRHPLITACTYLGRKWPHLARPGDELVRVSVGRAGDGRFTQMADDELVTSAFGELAHVLDIRGTATDSLVTRWDAAFPQYRVGHLIMVARIEQAVAGLGGVALAGAALRGVGIPACVASGRSAARGVLDSVCGSTTPSVGRSGRTEAGP